MTQGDPLDERGISAITRIMSDRLGIPRILMYLDPSIASYHAPNADRYRVSYEISFFRVEKSIASRGLEGRIIDYKRR